MAVKSAGGWRRYSRTISIRMAAEKIRGTFDKHDCARLGPEFAPALRQPPKLLASQQWEVDRSDRYPRRCVPFLCVSSRCQYPPPLPKSSRPLRKMSRRF
jgi:hypothetical protein